MSEKNYVTPRQRRRQMAKTAERLQQMRATEERIHAEAEAQRAIRAACNCRSGRGKVKRLYESDAAAVTAIRAMRTHIGGTYQVYKCPTTKSYHVTTRKPSG